VPGNRQGELRLLAATGCLGYGFTEVALQRALEGGLDLIAADAGSMDPGPYYLGAGLPFVSERAIERDLRLLLRAARAAGIPLVIGSAGGGGGDPHLALTRRILLRVAAAEGLRFRLAVIGAEVPRELVRERLRSGRVQPLWPVPQLTEAELAATTRIVAMMGAEPLRAALEGGADVVLAGRCSDSALYAVLPLMRGFDPGLAWHLGKTIECGGAIVRPKTGQDCVIGTLREDHFEVEPAHPDKACTIESVAAHTMYENPSCFTFVEPSGEVDTRAARYEALDPRRVKVSGSRFVPAGAVTAKLEGVALVGYRAVCMAGVADPVLIAELDTFSTQIVERVAMEATSLGIAPSSYTLTLRRYGLDAVLRRPAQAQLPHEVGLMLDVVAATPEEASAVLAKARYVAMHTDFPGRLCSAGNLAMPFAPSDIAVGPAYRFSVWHAMELNSPCELFPASFEDVGA
jgi:hypothetical protein